MKPFNRKSKKYTAIYFLIAITAGYTAGCIYIGFFADNRDLLDRILNADYLTDVTFPSAFVGVFVWLIPLFLCGFSVFGFWITCIISYFRFFFFGASAATCYRLYGIGGGITVISVIMPYAFLILITMGLLSVEATQCSYYLYRGINGSVMKNLLKNYSLTGFTLLLCGIGVTAWRYFISPPAVRYICSPYL